ncbi:MAG: SIMPL domain-containing protein [Acidimicrobiales bacterium]
MARPSFTGLFALVASVLAIALAASALGYSLSSSSTGTKARGSIVVSASATLTGVPDTLSVQLAVTSKASSAAAALNANDAKTARLEKVFVASGVRRSDLRTENLNVSATYNQYGTVTGYSAEDDLDATVHGIARAGRVIAAAENAVGNDVAINGISFSISNGAHLATEARVLAVRHARADAASFATGAGESVGPALRISNIEQTSTPIPFNTFRAASSSAHGVPVAPGTSSVTVHVTVTFVLDS